VKVPWLRNKNAISDISSTGPLNLDGLAILLITATGIAFFSKLNTDTLMAEWKK